MKVSTVADSDSVEVRVAGELDALSVSDFVPVLDQLLERRPSRLTVELADLHMIDSSGVVALIRALRKMRERGAVMIISGATAQPLAVLRLLRLDRLPDGPPPVSKPCP